MANRSESCPRRPWPLVCAALLVCYALVPFTDEGELNLHALAGLADVIAFIFSFPLGLLSALGLNQLHSGLGHRSQFWALGLAAGYVQWFHLVPLLFRQPPVRSAILNLAGDERVAPAAAPETLPADPRPAQLVAAHAQLMPQFNELGRTPLERVFDGPS
jgi:hypothetical protein